MLNGVIYNAERKQRLEFAFDVRDRGDVWLRLKTDGHQPNIDMDVAHASRNGTMELTEADEAITCSSGTVTPQFVADLQVFQNILTLLQSCIGARIGEEEMAKMTADYLNQHTYGRWQVLR